MPIAPGKTLLKIAGVFYVIVGAFSVVSGIALALPAIVHVPDELLRMTIGDFFAISDFMLAGFFLTAGNALGVPVNFLFVFTIIVSAAVLFGGLMTVKHCDYLKKAKRLAMIALANLIMMGLNTALNFSSFAIVGIIMALIYFAGAVKNHKAHERGL